MRSTASSEYPEKEFLNLYYLFDGLDSSVLLYFWCCHNCVGKHLDIIEFFFYFNEEKG